MTQAYFDSPALGRSDLKEIYNDPSMWRARRDGDIPQRKPTADMAFGSALDAMLTGGKGPDPLEGYLVLDHKDFRKDVAKDERDEAIENGWEREKVLSQTAAEKLVSESDDQLKRLDDCINELKNTPRAWELLQGEGQRQFYFDLPQGVAVKSLPDICHPAATVDLKVSAELDAEGFLRQCKRFWYGAQGALAQRGRMITDGDDEPLPVVFVIVQPVAPYSVEIFGIDDSILEFGWERIDAAVDRYQHCEATGIWRKPTWNHIVELTKPNHWKYSNQYQFQPEEIANV